MCGVEIFKYILYLHSGVLLTVYIIYILYMVLHCVVYVHILNLMCSFATSCRSAFAGAQCGVDFFSTLHAHQVRNQHSRR